MVRKALRTRRGSSMEKGIRGKERRGFRKTGGSVQKADDDHEGVYCFHKGISESPGERSLCWGHAAGGKGSRKCLGGAQ